MRPILIPILRHSRTKSVDYFFSAQRQTSLHYTLHSLMAPLLIFNTFQNFDYRLQLACLGSLQVITVTTWEERKNHWESIKMEMREDSIIFTEIWIVHLSSSSSVSSLNINKNFYLVLQTLCNRNEDGTENIFRYFCYGSSFTLKLDNLRTFQLIQEKYSSFSKYFFLDRKLNWFL